MRGKVAAVDAYHKGGRITPAHAGKRLLGRLPGMGGPDHPRACGEKTPVRFYENGVPGSPPRMRGKGVKARYERVAVGITPAHAGKSQFPGPSPALPRDHPRACGEKTFKTYELDVSRGSPPRMRGKVLPPPLAALHRGITPAYAGKSYCSRRRGSDPQDHPRVCGEKKVWYGVEDIASGSPPRMRGKAQAEQVRRFLNGITPAYAGKSVSRLLRKASLWDHPRVCGEKGHAGRQKLPRLGSPPRMRGKVGGGDVFVVDVRITPAYAGKSHQMYMGVVCSHGSPPRMRGKGLFFISSHRFFGITPAYAGKRVTSHFSNRSATDHPRVCGEKGRDRQKRRSRTGSPPRMRGKGRVVPGKSLL